MHTHPHKQFLATVSIIHRFNKQHHAHTMTQVSQCIEIRACTGGTIQIPGFFLILFHIFPTLTLTPTGNAKKDAPPREGGTQGETGNTLA